MLALAPQAELPRRARALQPLASLFSDADYPTSALLNGAEGTVIFRLEIDAAGAPSGCVVEESSGDPVLDSRTCEIVMERARYRPARNRAGRPVRDFHRARVTWRLADDAASIRSLPNRTVTSIHIAEDGQASCRIVRPGSPPPPPAGSQCNSFVTEAVAALRRLGREAEASLLLEVAEPGTPPLDLDSSYGDLAAEAEASLSVSPDGMVADCRMTRSRTHRIIAGMRGPPEICGLPLRLAPILPPVENRGELRTVRVRMVLYLRIEGLD